jgi:plasmid stabilization system protein ParE
MLLPLGLIALAVLVATASAISVQFHHQRETEATRMQAIAEVKTRQIADWLAERQGDANAMTVDRRIATSLARWSRQGDRASRDELMGQLRQFGKCSRDTPA